MPYPLPTKDGGVLRTIGDARAYMLALPKEREWLDEASPQLTPPNTDERAHSEDDRVA